MKTRVAANFYFHGSRAEEVRPLFLAFVAKTAKDLDLGVAHVAINMEDMPKEDK